MPPLAGTSISEVDSCLTTLEVQQLLEQYGIKELADVQPTALDLSLPVSTTPLLHGSNKVSGSFEAGNGFNSSTPVSGHAAHALSNSNSIGNGLRITNGATTSPGHNSNHASSAMAAVGGPAPEQLLGPPLHALPGGSGAYMDYVFRAAAFRLFGRHLPPDQPLSVKTLRNADFKEVVLLNDAGNILLRFACAYGFRNIQTLVRKIKTGRCEYDYVEVMACPGGCLNGGGQLKPRKGQTAAQQLEELERLYFVQQEGLSTAALPQSPVQAAQSLQPVTADSQQHKKHAQHHHHHYQQQQQQQQQKKDDGDSSSRSYLLMMPSPAMDVLYQTCVGDGPGSEAAQSLLHTAYHKREKTVTTVLGDW